MIRNNSTLSPYCSGLSWKPGAKSQMSTGAVRAPIPVSTLSINAKLPPTRAMKSRADAFPPVSLMEDRNGYESLGKSTFREQSAQQIRYFEGDEERIGASICTEKTGNDHVPGKTQNT